MLFQFLRTLFLGLLIAAGLLDYKIKLEKEQLWIIASCILIVLLLVDVITAFIFLIIVAVIYCKIYHSKKENVREFTTEENLKEIQSNVVSDVENYKGFKGVYGEEVYSAQGSF
jgi:heme/copper-type cytochrome/quinol oxidase subunit 2